MTVGLPDRIETFLALPYATKADLEKHCRTALEEEYRAITVPGSLIESAYDLLEGSKVKLACVVGFPFGSSDPDVKRYETEAAADLGVHEIELVPSISSLMEGNLKLVLREIRDVVEAADERPVKTVIESHLWSEKQLEEIAQMLLDSGTQFLSTSIALQGRHASADAVRHLRELMGAEFGLKVGGFRSLEGAEAIISAGADRIGLSS